MLSKKLVGTLGVLAAAALAPAATAQATPSSDARVAPGTQVGSEGVKAPQADGIIAILIGVVPPKGHLVQGMEGGAHGCPACPHPPPVVIAPAASTIMQGR